MIFNFLRKYTIFYIYFAQQFAYISASFYFRQYPRIIQDFIFKQYTSHWCMGILYIFNTLSRENGDKSKRCKSEWRCYPIIFVNNKKKETQRLIVDEIAAV